MCRCVVDAVIFSLRDNGFLVYIPVYAIKGPVYLENREKEVLCVQIITTWYLEIALLAAVFNHPDSFSCAPAGNLLRSTGACVAEGAGY